MEEDVEERNPRLFSMCFVFAPAPAQPSCPVLPPHLYALCYLVALFADTFLFPPPLVHAELGDAKVTFANDVTRWILDRADVEPSTSQPKL